MSKNTVIISVVIIILVVAGYFTFVKRPASPAQPTPSAQTQISGNQVIIKNFAFNPASISVKAGDTVQWTNQDTAPHTVSSDNNTFESGNLNPGQTFQFTFASAGTFAYHCSVHPSMKATVVVQ